MREICILLYPVFLYNNSGAWLKYPITLQLCREKNCIKQHVHVKDKMLLY